MEWSYLSVPATKLSPSKEEQVLLPKLLHSNDDKHPDLDETVAAAAKGHGKFLLQLQDLTASEVEEQAARDIKGVLYVFPIVQSCPEAIIAMSAWFRLLIAVDDAIERLSGPTAQSILEKCIELCRSVEDPKRADSPMDESADSDAATQRDRIAGWMQIFKTHLRAVVPDAVLVDMLLDISRVWRAMLREDSIANASSSFDEEAYFEVRRETTGLQPFFRLVEHSLGITSRNRMISM